MLKIPGTDHTVAGWLKGYGPAPLATIAKYTGLTVNRLQLHFKTHPEVFASLVDDDGVRHWLTHGEYSND